MGLRSIAVAALLLVACGDDGARTSPDPGHTPRDGSMADSAPLEDAGAPADDAAPSDDLGARNDDGGEPVDASQEALDGSDVPVRPEPLDGSVPPSSDAGTTVALLRFVPTIDAATKDRLRTIVAAGAADGLRPDVFSKIGDSITESASFGWDFGHGWIAYGTYEATMPTIERFSRVVVDDREEPLNSWSAHSLCATAGWTTADALASGSDSPLTRELDRTQGAFAIVMYGTNDLERLPESTYAANLRRIVDELVARHTVVVLSTVPPRTDDAELASRVDPYNSHVREVAAATGALLLDYHDALLELPGYGLSDDGVHPNVAPGDPGAGDIRDSALAYGYNVRNLLWLLTVDRLARVVLDDGPPEG